MGTIYIQTEVMELEAIQFHVKSQDTYTQAIFFLDSTVKMNSIIYASNFDSTIIYFAELLIIPLIT